jgi:O-methyltransferase
MRRGIDLMRFMKFLRAKWELDQSQLQALRAIAEGISNHSELLNRKFDQLFVAHDNQTDLINRKFNDLIARSSDGPCSSPEPTADHPQSDEERLETALETLSQYAGDERAAARIFDRVLDLTRRHHRGAFWGDRLLTLDKTAAFRDDPAFRRAIADASSSTGANQYASPDGITWRFNTLIWAARQALTVPGDFVECGVFEGDMSWVVTEMVDLAAAKRRFHLFDTFAGFSAKYSSPSDISNQPGFFEFTDSEYKRPEIYEHVLQRFATKPYVVIRKGVVPDSLADAPEVIAYLHLDMNSPGPERAALEILYERLSPGGVIVFDDYGWMPFRKQKESADEFINARGHTIVELPTGQGLAVKPIR